MQTILPHGVKLPPEKIKLPDQFSREKELREELSNLAVHSKLGTSFFVCFCNGRYSLLSFGGPQLYNSETLPFTYGQYVV